MLIIRPLAIFAGEGIGRLGHGEEKDPPGVGFEHLVPLRQGDRLQHRGLKRSRVIDQNIQPSKPLNHSSDCSLNTIDVANIAGSSQGPHVELLESFHRLLRFCHRAVMKVTATSAPAPASPNARLLPMRLAAPVTSAVL